MTIRDHANAVLARLRADTVLAGCTFEGVVIDRPDRYCTLFLDNGEWEADRFTGPQDVATFTATIHSVGSTAEQAQMVAERVFAQLLGFTPTVANRYCRRIRHVNSQPVQLDQDVSPPLYWCADTFSFTSSPLS